jgi:hypothetical protein
MQNEIDISKYAAYFHDGNLFNISKLKNEITFQMTSAEVDFTEIEKGLTLSKDHRIRGILHLYNIQSIKLTCEYKLENLFDVFNLGTVLDFEIINKTIELGILWENYPPKVHTNEFTTIVIQADRIWWENIPDLKHPLGFGIESP